MTFLELARAFDTLEATSSRTELVRILADVYRACAPEEIEAVTYLTQGRLAPFFEPIEIGLGDKTLMAAIGEAYGAPGSDVLKLSQQLGDLGLVAERLAGKRPGEPLSVTQVQARLLEIAGVSGAGSVQRRRELFAALLTDLDPVAAKHVARIAVGRMRLGIGDPTVLDALSFARHGDRSLRPLLEGAYNRTSDLGLIARTFWSTGERGIEALTVTVGKPIRAQLAERLPNPEAVIKRLGMVVVQPKYDGFRVQIHKDGQQVSLFSRRLENMTPMFPELVQGAEHLQPRSLILDGEAIGYNTASDEYLAFQETTQRRRKHGIDAMAERIPLRAFIFDILYMDGRDLTGLPYEQRLDMVADVVAGSEALQATPFIKTDSAQVLTRELLENISKGLEGVVVKRPDSPYQAGARNFNWVKLKRHTSGELTDTVDLVLLGYYFGRGKRTAFGAGALLAGVYDQAKDEFVTITRIGTGLSDEEWREIHKRGDQLQVDHKPARVNSLLTPDVWLEPSVVVEVMADEITVSPRHTAGRRDGDPGFALRFPRIVSFRSADKKPEDATSVREIAEMFRQQRQHQL